MYWVKSNIFTDSKVRDGDQGCIIRTQHVRMQHGKGTFQGS